VSARTDENKPQSVARDEEVGNKKKEKIIKDGGADEKTGRDALRSAPPVFPPSRGLKNCPGPAAPCTTSTPVVSARGVAFGPCPLVLYKRNGRHGHIVAAQTGERAEGSRAEQSSQRGAERERTAGSRSRAPAASEMDTPDRAAAPSAASRAEVTTASPALSLSVSLASLSSSTAPGS